ncbi:hypothetical protein PHMEG_00015473 [Phytophthora megakarya]|uniref:Uncharacterized protein n=1 Tax=Phytophthora megakarya TaxID=4795 RepID=A0A225W171_9STRA|nr:hypothetical protein PHMEG_00015473 [Phytophthora megakarya]
MRTQIGFQRFIWMTTGVAGTLRAGFPGFLPSQNPLESHNRVIKTYGVTSKRATMGMVLNDSIPGILVSFAMILRPHPLDNIGSVQFQVPSFIALLNTTNQPVSLYYFNAKIYMAFGSGSGVEVTKDRVVMYIAVKQGKLPATGTVNEINLHYFSMHEVEIINIEQAQKFSMKLEPVITTNIVGQIRSMYRCDCKRFWSNGCIYSHIVAVVGTMKQFDLDVAKETIPTTKLSGGQRKIPGAFYGDNPNSRTFFVPKLVKRMLKQPHYHHGWKVARDFSTEVNGETWTSVWWGESHT